ncbi:Uu.00g096350.m01.CDS01 [Anthostomella pinea]|uniref:Carboxylic ester hydrolase n=1 Tax=Anthostomella pinea TaxID=933095 RepID=A0AAI8VD72_9PEZI|nr:Uu.00g096350.m01.CDS01 [Anthostomella pinea]
MRDFWNPFGLFGTALHAATTSSAGAQATTASIASTASTLSTSIASIASISTATTATGSTATTVGQAAATTATVATDATLEDLCTVSHVQAALPAGGTLLGIELLPDTVTASVVYNATAEETTTTYDYCNVTVNYQHTGKSDTVVLNYVLPAPDVFLNRFIVTGGFAYELNTDFLGTLVYHAATGGTDGGYGALSGTGFDSVLLDGNGTINWDYTYMFAYQALGELTMVAKPLLQGFYDTDSKIYTYFQGCSDGGRQGLSQVQRYGDLYDGAILGAPAIRYGQLQTSHSFSNVVEQTLNYYPSTCEFNKIVNATIAACDPLDGRTDGVISRSDLCMLNFNLTSIIGESYSCAAASDGSSPAVSGSLSAEAVAVAQAIYDGLHTSSGDRAYVSYQVGSAFSDAINLYDSDTQTWGLNINKKGGEYVAKFVELLDIDNLPDLNDVTYDTLVDWMTTGFERYTDSLQTSLPDLTTFQSHGGKMINYHGESDPSIPTASTVRYWQSVRSIMYPNESEADSLAAMNDWYRLYLVPGADHCKRNTLQPDGPYPVGIVYAVIDWVEFGEAPAVLNATINSGPYEGEVQGLCSWPNRPLWQSGDNSTFDCVTDTASEDTWAYTFPAFKLPVY